MGCGTQAGMGSAWSVFWETLPPLSAIKYFIGALQGKIAPTVELAVRAEAVAAVKNAGGTAADVQQVQKDITGALESHGGSTLPEYGGSVWPDLGELDLGLKYLKWGAIGLGAVLLIVIIKD